MQDTGNLVKPKCRRPRKAAAHRSGCFEGRSRCQGQGRGSRPPTTLRHPPWPLAGMRNCEWIAPRRRMAR
eukprot:744482-Alexandrium_andersonii.AAC.1